MPPGSTDQLSARAEQSKKGSAPAVDFTSRSRVDKCGVKPTAADQLALIEQAANRSVADNGRVVTIPVYWHIITTTKGEGNVSSLVSAQMQVLNGAFASMDYTDDVCMDHFTADQTKRMRKHWHAFRDKKLRTN